MGGAYWEGAKLRLRAVEPGDAAAHHAFNQDAAYGLLDRIYPPGTLARVEEWAARQGQSGFEEHAFTFQMETLDDGTLVGSIATHHCDPRVGVVGYGLNVFDGHRGQGYASEAICLVLRYYFQELRYQKANVGVYACNAPSIRLHESLGFQLEGRLRRSAFTGGEFHDLLWYGMTAEEFRDRHPGYWRA